MTGTITPRNAGNGAAPGDLLERPPGNRAVLSFVSLRLVATADLTIATAGTAKDRTGPISDTGTPSPTR
jgi:hypothetical protein